MWPRKFPMRIHWFIHLHKQLLWGIHDVQSTISLWSLILAVNFSDEFCEIEVVIFKIFLFCWLFFLSQKDVSIAFSASKEILKFFTFTLSHIRLFVIPWIVACQAPLSIGFFRQEYWTGLHFLFQGIFLTQDRTQLCCISFIAGGSFTSEPLGETIMWPLPFIP